MNKLEEDSETGKTLRMQHEAIALARIFWLECWGSPAAIRKFDSETWGVGSGLAGQALRNLESGIRDRFKSYVLLRRTSPYGFLKFTSNGILALQASASLEHLYEIWTRESLKVETMNMKRLGFLVGRSLE